MSATRESPHVEEPSQGMPYQVIVGAGVTGLTVAYHLAEAGHPCLLLERHSEVGGLARSFVLDGIVFDLGPHVLFLAPDKYEERFIKSVLEGEDLISRPFQYAIYEKGRHWRFPNQWDIFFYPWRYKREILKALLLGPKGNQGEPEDSASRELASKSGKSFYDDVLGPFLLKKTLMPGERLHRDWPIRTDRDVLNEIEPHPPMHPLKRVRALLKRLNMPYIYPSRGFSTYPNALWRKYDALGRQTITQIEDLQFQMKDDRIHRIHVDGRSFETENVIWTGTINDLNDVLYAEAPRMEYLDLYILCMTFSRQVRETRPFVYVYYPDPNILFNRMYFPDNIYGEAAPKDREGLCVEISVNASSPPPREDDLLDQTLGGIERLGFYNRSALREWRVVHLRTSLPIYDLSYRERLSSALEKVHAIPNLYSIGRQGNFYFCMTPDATRQGLKMAKQLGGA